MLLWHKHDVEKSLADLANFTPFPDEWTVEDKVLFEQAFGFHGKCFQRIQQMVGLCPWPIESSSALQSQTEYLGLESQVDSCFWPCLPSYLTS